MDLSSIIDFSHFYSFLHRDEIEDEQYLFGGEKLTETELREFR